MKRTPFYRRPGRTGQFSGLRERVIWMIQTRGRPVTGSEIAEKFGVTLIEFNRVANGITLGVICKTGPGVYKKHMLGLSDNVTWFMEDLSGTNASVNHYRVTFKPSVIIPDIDIR
ncbi:hypothetical protein ACS6I8_14815 [Enterobacter kobei]|uniref:beta-sandwich lipoprotein n=1 Tax=Enterobacter kobei TaxID=208224 RepID=UPI003F42F0DE